MNDEGNLPSTEQPISQEISPVKEGRRLGRMVSIVRLGASEKARRAAQGVRDLPGAVGGTVSGGAKKGVEGVKDLAGTVLEVGGTVGGRVTETAGDIATTTREGVLNAGGTIKDRSTELAVATATIAKEVSKDPEAQEAWEKISDEFGPLAINALMIIVEMGGTPKWLQEVAKHSPKLANMIGLVESQLPKLVHAAEVSGIKLGHGGRKHNKSFVRNVGEFFLPGQILALLRGKDMVEQLIIMGKAANELRRATAEQIEEYKRNKPQIDAALQAFGEDPPQLEGKKDE